MMMLDGLSDVSFQQKPFFGNSHKHRHSGRLKLIATLLVLLEHRRSKYARRLGVL